MKSKLTFLGTLLSCFMGLFSCTDTIDYEPMPINLITQYRVAVSDGYLYGSIDNEANTITMYVPAHYELYVLDPEISLSDGSSLSEEIVPVDVTSTSQTYTVNGSDGSSRTYTLVIEVQTTAPLSLTEISSESSTTVFPIYGNSFAVYGNFNTTDAGKVQVYFVNEAGEVSERITESSIANYQVYSGNHGYTGLLVPADLEPGLYYVRVKVYNDSVQTTYPVELQFTQPMLYMSSTAITTTLRGAISGVAANSVITDLQSAKLTADGNTYDVEIASYTRTSFDIKLPASLTVGTYSRCTLTFKFDGWEDWTTPLSFSLTVTE